MELLYQIEQSPRLAIHSQRLIAMMNYIQKLRWRFCSRRVYLDREFKRQLRPQHPSSRLIFLLEHLIIFDGRLILFRRSQKTTPQEEMLTFHDLYFCIDAAMNGIRSERKSTAITTNDELERQFELLLLLWERVKSIHFRDKHSLYCRWHFLLASILLASIINEGHSLYPFARSSIQDAFLELSTRLNPDLLDRLSSHEGDTAQLLNEVNSYLRATLMPGAK